MHQARWMLKVLHTLKVWIFQLQLRLTAKEEARVWHLSVFAMKFYTKAWVEALNVAKVALRDLWCLQALEKYEEKEVAKATKSKFANHLQYLGKELMFLTLFDDVPLESKKAVTAPMLEEPMEEDDPLKRASVQLCSSLSLQTFVTERTRQFFNQLQLRC